ncbi:MAG: High-affinity nickel-transporter [Pseudonocardia sp.]
MRFLRRAAAVLVGVGALLLAPVGPTAAPAAQAHPLGNFTVNHYDGLELYPDRIEILAVLDTAEIPTVQQRGAVDADGDGTYSVVEAAGHAAAECAQIAGSVAALVDGVAITFTVRSAAAAFPPGEGGLATTRVTCRLVAPADLTGSAEVEFTDDFRADRIGWREITATGDGLRIDGSDVPAQSASQQLRAYPEDPLLAPLDQRSARISVVPGGAGARSAGVPLGGDAAAPLASLPTTGVGWVDSVLSTAEGFLTGLAQSSRLTPAAGALAVLMAIVLGASHAAMPGHGKAVMAAYLAGRQGTRRDALAVGAMVTITHTAGVLVFGLLITLVATFAPEAAMRWLGVLSGLLVAAVGLALLGAAVRRHRQLAALPVPERTGVLVGAAVGGDGAIGTGHEHGHGGSGARGLERGYGHGHGHGHSDGLGHGHGWGHGHGFSWSGQDGWSRASLIGMGVAGGLVPSPTALLVLLAAVDFERAWFGIGLVLCYALGMAATLTGAGLLLVSMRDRLARVDRAWWGRTRRLQAALPVATAVLVLVVGTGLALRSLAG